MFNYNPMTYDVMDELATQLEGALVARKRRSPSLEEQAAVKHELDQLVRETMAVDATQREAVEAFTAQLRERLARERDRA